MRSHPILVSWMLIVAAFFVGVNPTHAQVVVGVGVKAPVSRSTAEGDVLRGAGSYLNGMGWYNLNTAKADAVRIDAEIRWKQDLRKSQQERHDIQEKIEAGKNLKIEELKRRQQERERQLRTNPTANDIEKGNALNALLFDLTDPDITPDHWKANPIRLPQGLSVKDLIFQFVPPNSSSNSSKALGQGVIALSRLDVEGKWWPTVLQFDAISAERTAYELAYAKVRNQVIAGDFSLDAILEMDKALDALKGKVKTSVPVDRGFRLEAEHFLDDLKNSTRMFDASTVEYAREILMDTQQHDAETVAELVAFTAKFRLQFASAERSPSTRVLYGKLYDLMTQQAKALGIDPTGSGGVIPKWTSLFNGQNLVGWKQHPDSTGKWTVEDGAIVGRGREKSYLLSEKGDYTDFHLRVEAMISPTGDSGLCFRTIYFGRGIIKGRGYCATIQGNNPRGPQTGSLIYHPQGKVVTQLAKPEEWFEMEVIMIGNNITIKVNGQVTVDVVDSENTYKRGHIAISEVGEDTEIRVRKVEIKDLSRGK